MTAPNSADLSNILCLFRLLQTDSCSSADLASIREWNKEFEFNPLQPHKEPKPPWAGALNLNGRCDPIYALRFSEKPKKDGIWVFGSLDGSRSNGFGGGVPTKKDQSRCDFQLSASHVQSNISRTHFAIELAPRVRVGAPANPRLKCLKGSVVVNYVKDPDHSVLLHPGDELVLGQPTNVLCATLQLQVWVPTLTPEELAEQRTTANEFERNIVNEIGTFFPSIRSGVDTRHANTRVGLKSGAFYVCFAEKAAASTSVIPSCVVWSGPSRLSATVLPITSGEPPGSVKSKTEGLMRAFGNAGGIHHPSILTIHEIAVYRGVGYEDNATETPWLITELIEGAVTLEDCIQSGLFSIDGYEVITQLASGLACLMSEGVVHTDFTPESIVMIKMANGQLIPKIARLEQSQKLGGKQYLEDRVTTPTIYTAPERLQTPYRYSYAAPAYGLGAIALRMLTSYDSRMKAYKGEPPFTSQSYGEWISKVVLPSLKEAPGDTQELIKGLLHSKPRERWTVEEGYNVISQRLSPRHQASSDSGKGRPRNPQRRAQPSATTLRAKAIGKLAQRMNSSTTQRSEPQATEGTGMRNMKVHRRSQRVRFEKLKPTEVASTSSS